MGDMSWGCGNPTEMKTTMHAIIKRWGLCDKLLDVRDQGMAFEANVGNTWS